MFFDLFFFVLFLTLDVFMEVYLCTFCFTWVGLVQAVTV